MSIENLMASVYATRKYGTLSLMDKRSRRVGQIALTGKFAADVAAASKFQGVDASSTMKTLGIKAVSQTVVDALKAPFAPAPALASAPAPAPAIGTAGTPVATTPTPAVNTAAMEAARRIDAVIASGVAAYVESGGSTSVCDGAKRADRLRFLRAVSEAELSAPWALEITLNGEAVPFEVFAAYVAASTAKAYIKDKLSLYRVGDAEFKIVRHVKCCTCGKYMLQSDNRISACAAHACTACVDAFIASGEREWATETGCIYYHPVNKDNIECRSADSTGYALRRMPVPAYHESGHSIYND